MAPRNTLAPWQPPVLTQAFDIHRLQAGAATCLALLKPDAGHPLQTSLHAKGLLLWLTGQTMAFPLNHAASRFDAVRAPLTGLAPRLWEVRAGENALPPREVKVELLPGDNVSFHFVFPLPPGIEQLTLRAPRLPDLPTGHRQFVIIADDRGSTLTKKLLSAKDNTLEVRLGPGIGSSRAANAGPAPADAAPTAWGFIKLGVEHIWTGFDHLLFLFALLIVCRSFRSIVAIVTCFTLAHSLTLALATLEVVNLPARLVESRAGDLRLPSAGALRVQR